MYLQLIKKENHNIDFLMIICGEFGIVNIKTHWHQDFLILIIWEPIHSHIDELNYKLVEVLRIPILWNLHYLCLKKYI